MSLGPGGWSGQGGGSEPADLLVHTIAEDSEHSKIWGTGGIAQVVEVLSSKHQALTSNPHTLQYHHQKKKKMLSRAAGSLATWV
jgi:hypothetical protein